MTHSQILKAANQALGWDEKGNRLAKETGIDITLVRRYLSGEVQVGMKNLAKISHALGVSPIEFMGGAP